MIKILLLLSIFMLACTQQEIVDGTKQSKKLDEVGSDIVFALASATPNTQVPNQTLRALNTQIGSRMKVFTDQNCSNEIFSSVITQTVTEIPYTAFIEGEHKFYFELETIDFKKSSCLDTKLSFNYDSTPPTGPSAFFLNTHLSNNPRPGMTISGVDIGDQITIYDGPTCAREIAQVTADASTEFFLIEEGFINNTSHDIHYSIIDQAGNQKLLFNNSCLDSSINFEFDSIAPSEASEIKFNGTTSISNQSTININFKGGEVNSFIRLYTDPFCISQKGFSVYTAPDTDVEFNTELGINEYRFYYRVSDAAGNITNCVDTNLEYTYDNGNPLPVVLENITEKSIFQNGVSSIIPYPAAGERNTLNIRVSNIEASAKLEIFEQASCSGAPLYSQQINQTQTVLDIKLPSGGDYALSARLEDEAGNFSTCSNEVNYTYKEITQVSLGSSFSCTNFSDRQTYCFGDNSKGQLGIGVLSEYEIIPRRVLPLFNSDLISTGLDHTCHLDQTTNKLWCHGDNDKSALGLPINTNNFYPTPQNSQPTLDFLSISSGEKHNCAINTSNQVMCFGRNNHGQLGRGTISAQEDTALIVFGAPIAQALSAGGSHSCYINSSQYHCFGLNSSEQLGLATPHQPSISTPELTPGGSEITNFTSSTDTNCYIAHTPDNPLTLEINEQEDRLYCFGNGENNKIGTNQAINPQTSAGDSIINMNIPQLINGDIEYIKVSTGNSNTCAISKDHKLHCFGKGYNGIEDISNGLNFIDVEVSLNHLCATTDIGELYCKGANNKGQLGIGSLNQPNALQRVEFNFNQANILIEEGSKISLNDITTPFEFDEATQSYPSIDFSLTISNKGDAQAALVSFNTTDPSLPQIAYKDGVYPGTGGSCASGQTIDSNTSCSIVFTYTPISTNIQGLTQVLTLSYSDSTQLKTASIQIEAFTQRKIPDFDIKTDSNTLVGSLNFNTALSPINASLQTTINKVISLENNSADIIEIQNATINGSDYIHFNYTGGSFPGTAGNCSGLISPQSTCELDITYQPKLASMTLPDNSHQASISLNLKKGTSNLDTQIPLKGFAVNDSPLINTYVNTVLAGAIFQFNNPSTVLIPLSQELDRVFEFRNDGNASAIIQSSTIIENDIGQFELISNNCINGLILAIGESCLISMKYKPVSSGTSLGHSNTLILNYSNQMLELEPIQTQTQIIKGFAL